MHKTCIISAQTSPQPHHQDNHESKAKQRKEKSFQLIVWHFSQSQLQTRQQISQIECSLNKQKAARAAAATANQRHFIYVYCVFMYIAWRDDNVMRLMTDSWNEHFYVFFVLINLSSAVCCSGMDDMMKMDRHGRWWWWEKKSGSCQWNRTLSSPKIRSDE